MATACPVWEGVATVEDVGELAGELVPFVTAAVGAYGVAVLTRMEEGAADATVSFGRRVLRRLTGRGDAGGETEPSVEQAGLVRTVGELAGDPQDAEARAMLRGQIRRILADDPGLAAEITGWARPPTPASVVVSTTGPRSPAVGTNYGTITTGDTPPPTAR